MSELFEVPELVRIAVEDERTGVALYTSLAESARAGEVKALFLKLVGQERYHQMRFENMLEQLGGHKPHEDYDGEYLAYLRTLTSTRAFPEPEDAMKAARQCKTDADSLELAGRYERETLALINELRELVGEKHKTAVEDIAREERAHVVVLAEARRMLRA
jgi:rubrerythrin